MAASIVVEEERGTYTGTPSHPHNGYYAGEFTDRLVGRPAAVPVPPAGPHL
jgi:hypothetical protein